MRCAPPATGLLLCLATACGGADPAPADAPAPPAVAAGPTRLHAVEGFRTPESVVVDVLQDVYFVSNINGNPSARDGNGFISKLRPDGTIEALEWIAGGRDGVTLHAPKGLALIGDTLWVADLDALRAFHRGTGAPMATVEFGPRAAFLNDVAVGLDGALYVSESGIRFTPEGGVEPTGLDAVFRVGPGRRIERLLDGAAVPRPNGVALNPEGDGLLVVSIADPGMRLWQAGRAGAVPAGTGFGPHDGLAVLDDGRVLASSWADSSIAVLGTEPSRLVTGLPSPADFDVDRRRGRLVVPLFTADRVEVWTLR